MAVFSIVDFGAVGDGKTNDAMAIQKAIDACHGSGGGRVVVPAGKVFMCGTIILKSFVELHVEPGAELIGSDEPEDYQQRFVTGEYAAGKSGFMIVAEEAEHIAITGGGVIDHRGRLYMDGYRSDDGPYIRKPKDWRPRMIGLYASRSITIRDITLKDAANWCLHLTACDDVVISGVRILNDLVIPNCDGIDPDHCTNVRISDCHIEAGDDCIVVKATKGATEYLKKRSWTEDTAGGSHNITVTNCTCISTSAAIKIGTESHGDFTNITFTNCVVRSSSRGLAIQLRDHGNVENVLFSNMTIETRLFSPHWWGRAEPIYVTAIPRNDKTKVGRLRHVRFSDIICRSENGAFIAGCDESAIEDLVMDNVRIEVDKWSKWPGGQHDRRPTGGEEHGGLSKHATSGVFIEYAKDVRLTNVDVVWGEHRPEYFGAALEACYVDGLTLDGFRGEAAQATGDARIITNTNVTDSER